MKDRQPEPELGGATEALVHERASATPATQTATRGRASDGSAAPPAPRTTALRELEHWFVDAVTSACDDDAVGEAARAVLTRGPKLEAPERLGIYRYAYRARLVECLIDDYPALQAALGAEAFEALCHEYIERHPSSAPSLNFFGRHMALFCRSEARGPVAFASVPRDFAADLAALEWALVEVLHARVAEALSPALLGAIAPERWPAARLPPSPAVRVLRFDYPVNAFFQAFKTGEGESPEIPGRAPSATAVYRTDMTLWRMNLTPAMASLLEALFRGETLGEALGKLEDGLSEAEAGEAERSVMTWFREWVAAGVFARVEIGPA